MSTATLNRSSGSGRTRTSPSSPAADDAVTVALRGARFAEIWAETADWIAADLARREAGGGHSYAVAAARIRARAARCRAEARRLRLAAGVLRAD